MKEHTLQDVEDLIAEFSTKGENVTELSRVVHELEVLVDEEHEWERQNPEKVRTKT